MVTSPLGAGSHPAGATGAPASDGTGGQGSAPLAVGGQSKGPAPPQGAQQPKVHVSKVAHVGYYFIVFWAHWFGAARFDVDEDGDFDPADVQAYLADAGWLGKHFQQTRTSRRRQAKVKQQRRKQANQLRQAFAARAQAEGKPAPRCDDEIFTMFGEKIDESMDALEAIISTETQKPPLFVLFQTLLMVLLWLIFAVKGSTENQDISKLLSGLESLWPGRTDLRWAGPECQDLRSQVWRWWTYQFTHVGIGHLVSNSALLILLGIPLEGLYGSVLTCLLFNAGVIGGAACFMLFDTHSSVLGASGGCVALLGMHLAYVVMNWRETKFRWLTLFVLAVLQTTDIVVNLSGLRDGKSNVSGVTHLGGYLAGLLGALTFGRNLKVRRWERVLAWCAAAVAVAWTALVIAWVATNKHSRSLLDAGSGSPPYCWVRQVFSTRVNQRAWECVSCWSPTCIQSWEASALIQRVSQQACDARGYFHREDESIFNGTLPGRM